MEGEWVEGGVEGYTMPSLAVMVSARAGPYTKSVLVLAVRVQVRVGVTHVPVLLAIDVEEVGAREQLPHFLRQLEKEVPAEVEVHLMLDNYSTHKSAEVQAWLKPTKRQRFHFHFTPTSGSWLNQVERRSGLIAERMIRRGTFGSVQELEAAIYQWLAQ